MPVRQFTALLLLPDNHKLCKIGIDITSVWLTGFKVKIFYLHNDSVTGVIVITVDAV